MIQHILFDLDNTLYSPRLGIEARGEIRRNEYTARLLNVSTDEARQLRKAQVPQYGTTLLWLVEACGLSDIDDYCAMVHPENEADGLEKDPALKEFLEGLPLPYGILTNSPIEHALRILEKLGIRELFEHIIDIRKTQFRGKPNPLAYGMALDALGAAAETTLFIDDSPSFVKGFLDMGGKGILIDEENEYPDYPHPKIRKLEELTLHL